MAMAPLPHPQRLNMLEQALLDLAHSQARAQEELSLLSADVRLLSSEMREFKDEMREFKDEMREDTRAFKQEMRASAERADKRWGELANKMGTLVEDIVFPGVAGVFTTLFPDRGEPECAIRVRRRHAREPGLLREFDCIAMAGDAFLVVETKSSASATHVEALCELLRGELRDYFPEAASKRVFGALASFHVDPSVVRAGERQGLLMLGLGSGLLRVLNTPDFEPQAY